MFNFIISKLGLSAISTANLLLFFSMLVVLMPHTLRIPFWLTLYCLTLLCWRLFIDKTQRQLPNKIIKFLLLVIGIVGILISYQTIVGLNAGSAVLILMFFLKLTELKNNRDAFVVIFLGYFIVITGFLFSQSIPVAVYMIIAVLALTTSLISFQHPASLSFQRHHLKLASRMLAYSVPLAIVLFMLFPRTSGPLWGLPEDAYSAKSGLSDQMSPGRISRLSESNEIAFRVKFNDFIPEPSSLYWRGPVLWNFNGSQWTSPKHERLIANNYSVNKNDKPVNYAITLQPHNNYWLFSLDLPFSKPAQSHFTSDLLILSDKPVNKVLRYSLSSYTDSKLGKYNNLPFNRYLQLPASSSPKTKALITQWKSQTSTDSALVQTALNFFTQNEFYYSRKPPLLFDDPVDEFLFETRKGFCEHYASAFTVMMRMAGIPARVVTGYFGGEMNPLADYLIVRQSDAHAWTEVFIEDKGWVRIDPTSSIHPSRIENNNDVVRIKPQSEQAITILSNTSWLYRSYSNISYFVDSINNKWNQWVIGYNNQKQIALFSAIGVPEITWKGLSTIMFILLSFLMAIFSYYILKSRQKLDPVNKAYMRFCNKMKKSGFNKQEKETANQFASRIIIDKPELKSSVLKITTLYNTLHYGQYQTNQKQQALIDAINSLKI